MVSTQLTICDNFIIIFVLKYLNLATDFDIDMLLFLKLGKSVSTVFNWLLDRISPLKINQPCVIQP